MANTRIVCLLALLLTACSEEEEKCEPPPQGTLLFAPPEHWNEWDQNKRNEWTYQNMGEAEYEKCLERHPQPKPRKLPVP